jgi:tetratricopeptide (TPR) repeat protein
MQYEWDFAGAESECRRAIELDPNSALAHQTYSRFLNCRGRFDEAIAEIKTAIDLEPASLFSQRVYGTCLFYARRYPDAEAQLKRVLAIDPKYNNTLPWLWQSLETQEKYPEAFEYFIKSLSRTKEDIDAVPLYTTAFQQSGWPGVLREQLQQFERGNIVYFHIAEIYAKLGDKDKAFEYLERSFQRRELWMGYLMVSPSMDSLRGDPRFDDLFRRVEPK